MVLKLNFYKLLSILTLQYTVVHHARNTIGIHKTILACVINTCVALIVVYSA